MNAKQLLFGLSCLDRVIDLYDLNDNKQYADYIDREVINDCRNYLYDNLINEYKATEISKMLKKITKITPDSDDYGTFEDNINQYISIMIAYLLDYIKDPKNEYIEYCRNYLVETIDSIYFEKFSNNSDSSTICSKELEVQKEIKSFIENISLPITKYEIMKVKEISKKKRIKSFNT